jgi:hypothetical protein
MPRVRAKSEIGSSRSQRGRPVSLGGSAGVGGSWSDGVEQMASIVKRSVASPAPGLMPAFSRSLT